MNPSLQRLIALAEDVTPLPGGAPVIGFEVYAPQADDDPVLTGHYRHSDAHDRRAFGQSVGKLLAAGYEIITWRMR